MDAYTSVKLKEQDNIFTPRLVPTSGTLTLSSATVTLYDHLSAVAGGVSGAVASVTSGASTGPQAWYLLKPAVLNIAAGLYTLAFVVIDSNGIRREPTVMVKVIADDA